MINLLEIFLGNITRHITNVKKNTRVLEKLKCPLIYIHFMGTPIFVLTINR